MSNLTERLVMRISPELSEWVGQQAELEGLDSATWVRSMLTRLKNGLIGKGTAPQRLGPEQPAVLLPVQDYSDVDRELVAPGAQVDQSGDPVDIDALVGDALNEAEAQGRTDPREEADQPMEAGGVRAIVRHPPPFSRTPLL